MENLKFKKGDIVTIISSELELEDYDSFDNKYDLNELASDLWTIKYIEDGHGMELAYPYQLEHIGNKVTDWFQEKQIKLANKNLVKLKRNYEI